MTATELVNAYCAALDAGDMPALLELLSENLIHDINQGERQMGKARFAAFMDERNRCYRERLADIVVMHNADGSRAAAEFTVHGEYLATDAGQPAAEGQTYVLSAGTFFYIHCGKIARVTPYRNLSDWREQVQ
ncbi:nuclear transport factor 2 family protein [Pseudomonas sp. S75]|uniref:ketosteroid isomerase-related protein n=1 Tax=unclassified Pseudomonas TaxID=196821 RepID=UPI001908E9C0|nr:MULTISPECIES: ketosteroid isomerase-related protein [unclassified Pseudomonas]MBJ9976839.1 nuclear transport factor 2 family protein [Pseudomonas sp. S30]MBK0153886.1 nuclear transport factor 2 family protein [Pseudomonas sp. S75]